YVLHGPGDGPEGIFDESSNSIALVFTEVEIQSTIHEYQSKRRASGSVSIVLYEEQLNLDAVSAAVWSIFDRSISAVERDKYTHHVRHYRGSGSWLLADDDDELIALCRESGMPGEKMASCDFRANLKGLGVAYDLDQENIALTERFESFIAEKLDEWGR
ncbi:hypothetical protein, partial [Marinimicrobium alkaliphilum]|uniref:hypothetical protein n=1 Tax=Marinimicrobium alkaliphilum TaxID=2202654 RepID=UPI001300433A